MKNHKNFNLVQFFGSSLNYFLNSVTVGGTGALNMWQKTPKAQVYWLVRVTVRRLKVSFD